MQDVIECIGLIILVFLNLIMVIRIGQGELSSTKPKNPEERIQKPQLVVRVFQLMDSAVEFLFKPIKMIIFIIIIAVIEAMYCVFIVKSSLKLGVLVGGSLLCVLLIMYLAFHIVWRIIDKARKAFEIAGVIWLLLFFSTLLDLVIAYGAISGFLHNSSLILVGVYCIEIIIIIYTLYKITKMTTEMIIKVGTTEEAKVAEASEATEETKAIEAAGITEEAKVTEALEATEETKAIEAAGATEETKVTEASEATETTKVVRTTEITEEIHPVVLKLQFIILLNIMHILLFSLFMYYLHTVSIILRINENTPHFYEFSDTSADTTMDIENELNNTELFRYLNRSYYYVTTTYTSVGYGDVVPITVCARAFSMFISLDGFFMSAVIIGMVLESFKVKFDKNTG